MKKILLVSHSPLVSGGAERSLMELINYLLQEEYIIRVALPGQGPFAEYLDSIGVDYVFYPAEWSAIGKNVLEENGATDNSLSASNIVHKFNIINDFKPDILLTNTIVVPGFVYAAKTLGVINTIYVHEFFDANHDLALVPNVHWYTKQLAECLDFVIYNSDFTRLYYEQYPIANIDSVVLPPIASILPLFQKRFEPLNISKNRVRLIVVGVVSPRKSQNDVVRALHILRQQGFDCVLTILGEFDKDDFYYQDLRKLVSDFGLQEFVTFAGFHDNPVEVIAENDVLVNASTYESFGRVTVEAGIAGRLAVAANNTATTELIDDGVTGLFYDTGDYAQLADKLVWVIEHPVESEAIALKGQESVRNNYFVKDLFKETFGKIGSIEKECLLNVGFDYNYVLIKSVSDLVTQRDELVTERDRLTIELHKHSEALESALKRLKNPLKYFDLKVLRKIKRVAKKLLGR